jgi:hypothetical protein
MLASAAIGAGAFVLLAGVAVAGYEVHHPATVTRTVTVTHTITQQPKPAPTVTRTVTRTVTHTAAPSVPCQEIDGSPEPGVVVQGLPGDTTCTVTLVSPMGASHLAQLQLTAPDGGASTWNLANPNG